MQMSLKQDKLMTFAPPEVEHYTHAEINVEN